MILWFWFYHVWPCLIIIAHVLIIAVICYDIFVTIFVNCWRFGSCLIIVLWCCVLVDHVWSFVIGLLWYCVVFVMCDDFFCLNILLNVRWYGFLITVDHVDHCWYCFVILLWYCVVVLSCLIMFDKYWSCFVNCWAFVMILLLSFLLIVDHVDHVWSLCYDIMFLLILFVHLW